MTRTAGPNMSDAARRLGVTRAAVSRWCSGDRLPQLEQRKRIEKAYGWPIGKQAEAEADGSWARRFLEVLANADITP